MKRDEPLSYKDIMALFASMFINALPAIALGMLYAGWQCYIVRTTSNAVLDVPPAWGRVLQLLLCSRSCRLPSLVPCLAVH